MLIKIKNILSAYPVDFYLVSSAIILLAVFFIFTYPSVSQPRIEYIMDDTLRIARDITRTHRGTVLTDTDIQNILNKHHTRDDIFFAVVDKENQIIHTRYENRYHPFYNLSIPDLEICDIVGYFELDINGSTWIYGFAEISDQFSLIIAHGEQYLHDASRSIIIVMCVSSLFCLWFTKKGKNAKPAPFEYISDWIIKDYSASLPKFELNSTRVSHIIHISIIMTTVFYAIFTLNFYTNWTAITIHLLIMIVACISLLSYRNKQRSDIWSYLFITVLFLGTVMIYLYDGIILDHMIGIALFWTMSAVLLKIFLLSTIKSKRTFRIYVYFLFCITGLILLLFEHVSHAIVFSFISSLLFLGFSLYTVIDIYIYNSKNDYIQINDLLTQARETRDADIQKENMATLRQLIANITHEINTPIGAVKASGDQINHYLYNNLEDVLVSTKHFDQESFTMLHCLIRKTNDSLSDMKTTSEIRKCKRKMLTLFEELGIPDHIDIVNKLVSLEICDIDFINNNLDLFQNPKITEILNVLVKLSPVITAASTVAQASDRISKIIFSLKSYTYVVDSSEHIIFDVVHTLDNMLLFHRNKMQNINIVRNIPDNVPKVLGNPYEISQVWNNIIHNALYAMTDTEGTLTIGIELIDEFLQISFADTGVGMTPEVLDKAFDPFFSTKPMGEGSGLGLDVCKKTVECHSGDIRAESKPEFGSCFYVTLPTVK